MRESCYLWANPATPGLPGCLRTLGAGRRFRPEKLRCGHQTGASCITVGKSPSSSQTLVGCLGCSQQLSRNSDLVATYQHADSSGQIRAQLSIT